MGVDEDTCYHILNGNATFKKVALSKENQRHGTFLKYFSWDSIQL